MQSIQKLIEIMQALRDPDKGCPWDLQQDFQSLIPFTLEEAYEVADAIERNNLDDIKTELGDLLFQIVFYCQLASEQQAFDFDDVAQSISDKLTRRHPHVFADTKVKDAEEQTQEWDRIKQLERKEKADKRVTELSHLDDVSRTLPSLMRAEKLQRRAAREGFDWPDIEGVFDKVSEELSEVHNELNVETKKQSRVEDEIGDLFFSCVNLSRHAGVDAETCLRKANQKFEQRFRALEKKVKVTGLQVKEMNSNELEKIWQKVKVDEND